jgi:hypothetical protein
MARVSRAPQIAGDHGNHSLAKPLIVTIILDDGSRAGFGLGHIGEWEVNYDYITASGHDEVRYLS